MPMIAAAALLALAAPSPAPPEAAPVRARAVATIRIIQAVEVRDGHTAEPHQRRAALSPEGAPLTLIEFE